MYLGLQWNGADSQNPQYSEENVCHCKFICHKSNMDWPGIDLRSRG